MIVVHAGLPRSGTVLVGAILRQLFEGLGVRVYQSNPHGSELKAVLSSPHASADVHLIHTHAWDTDLANTVAEASPKNFQGFLCWRDPRDVCVSIMQLHDLNFEDAAELTLAHISHFHWMRSDSGWPVVHYDNLWRHKTDQIRRIALHLDLKVSSSRISQIDQDTSLERFRSNMMQVREGLVPHIVERHNRNRVLREDRQTLINDRHIQSGKIGRWQNELSPEEQDRAQLLFADYSDPFNL